MFQDETQKITLRSLNGSDASSSTSYRSQRTRSRSVERVSGPPLRPLSTELHSLRPWLKKDQTRKPPSVEDQVAESFMNSYVLYPCNESSSPGFLEHLPCLFKEVNVDGRHALRSAVQAAGFADASRLHHSQEMTARALECYGQALNSLGLSLSEKGKTPDDYDLMTVVVLDIFEVRSSPAG